MIDAETIQWVQRYSYLDRVDHIWKPLRENLTTCVKDFAKPTIQQDSTTTIVDIRSRLNRIQEDPNDHETYNQLFHIASTCLLLCLKIKMKGSLS